jgi:hypothetical protein
MQPSARHLRRRSRTLALLASAALFVGLAAPASAATNDRLTVDASAGSYLRYDGTSDASTIACSTGRRHQNEPTVAINPRNTQIVVAGSNDYCLGTVNGDVWAGYYRSTDGGATWRDSLVPGYPGDTSTAGLASPTTNTCAAAGDPTQSFDTGGRLFYGFICFNRAKPSNGSLYVATYDADGAHYVRTIQVDRGTPSVWGLFQDKINVVADQTSGPTGGNLYVAWVRYPGQSANNVLMFSRSTDHGQAFSKPIRVTQGLGEEQFADLAVGPNGNIYITYRVFAHQSSTSAAIWVVRSTDGGLTFDRPIKIADLDPFDGEAFGGGTCGDGPFTCDNGFTYPRFASLSAVAADATGVHVVWSGRTTSGQAKIYVRNSADGVSWPSPATTIDSVATGHQWFPDVASADGAITAIFYDSRGDSGYSTSTVPGNTSDGKNSGDVINVIRARSTDGGTTWAEATVTDVGSNLNWEQFGSRRSPFAGDYIYVSAVHGAVYGVWTDSRDVLAGDDPRETGGDDDKDGFDIFQEGCVYTPNDINAASYSSPLISDPCLSQGGMDMNIYGAGL